MLANASFASTLPVQRSETLETAIKGDHYRIVGLLSQSLFGALDESVTLRLKELGFLPGCDVQVIGFGLLGHDPLAVRVNGTKFALRRAEAAKICVERLEAAQ